MAGPGTAASGDGGGPPRPIFVTGAHRSGTTWVGRMLCASGEAAYVHEPFNVAERAPWLALPVPHWNLYVTAENEGPYRAAMERVVRLRFPLAYQRHTLRSLGHLRSVAKRAGLSAGYRLRRQRPLLKDPIAIFSTPWLVDRFGVEPVVMIRHPAAFASSIKRLAWQFDFRDWLDQPLLVRDLLGPFEAEVRAAGERDLEPLDQAIVVWRVVYGVVHRFQREHPDWCFVRHEDLAADPDSGFADLYERLGLRFDERARAAVRAHSSRGSGADPDPPRHHIRRDSRVARDAWTSRLTTEEVARVRAGVEDVAAHYYDDRSWETGVERP